MPQVRKSTLLEAIEQLETIITKPEIDIKEFNQTMERLSKHEFYLDPEMCREINDLRLQIEDRFPKDTTVRIVYRNLEPNDEMNESYFLK